jgi:hypothetical protein
MTKRYIVGLGALLVGLGFVTGLPHAHAVGAGEVYCVNQQFLPQPIAGCDDDASQQETRCMPAQFTVPCLSILKNHKGDSMGFVRGNQRNMDIHDAWLEIDDTIWDDDTFSWVHVCDSQGLVPTCNFSAFGWDVTTGSGDGDYGAYDQTPIHFEPSIRQFDISCTCEAN